MSLICLRVPARSSSTPLLRMADVSVYLHSYLTAVSFPSETSHVDNFNFFYKKGKKNDGGLNIIKMLSLIDLNKLIYTLFIHFYGQQLK